MYVQTIIRSFSETTEYHQSMIGGMSSARKPPISELRATRIARELASVSRAGVARRVHGGIPSIKNHPDLGE